MNLALVGMGNMGRAVVSAVAATPHRIVAQFNSKYPPTAAALEKCDVVIDFSTAAALRFIVEQALAAAKPLVTGTTGWQEQLPEIKILVESRGGSFLHAPNFSLGVLLFQQLARSAAQLFAPLERYDFALHEIHHAGKRDSPSGTALALAEALRRELPQKERILIGNREGKISKHELQISSTRVGAVPGTHRVFIDSPEDSIELVHTARGRAGFAAGALKGAEWLLGKKGFFSIEDMLADLLPGQMRK